MTVRSVTEAVIGAGASGDLDADVVGRADGDFSGGVPASLADAILARSGVGDDAGAPARSPPRGAERPGTMTSRRPPRSISAKIRPSWRMIARSAKPPCQSMGR